MLTMRWLDCHHQRSSADNLIHAGGLSSFPEFRRHRRLVNHDARDRLAILLLLGCVDTMSSIVHSEAVDKLLHRKVLDFSKMRSVVFLENRNEAACASCIHPAKAGIVLDYIRTLRQR